MRTIRAEPRHAVGALAGCAVFRGMSEEESRPLVEFLQAHARGALPRSPGENDA